MRWFQKQSEALKHFWSTLRLHLTASLAFRSQNWEELNIISALHPPPQRRQVRRVVRPLLGRLYGVVNQK